MAFSDEKKLEVLKRMMIKAVKNGTSWDELKAEFTALSTAFKDETKGFLSNEENKAVAEEGKWGTYKDDVDSLSAEIEGL